MKRRHFLALAAVSLVAAGCPQGGGSGGGGNVYTIAVAAPFTGKNAAFGEQIKLATELKLEEVNAAGGINGKKVVAIYEDDRGDTSEAANVSRKLASNPDVLLVIGHFNSTCSIAAKEEYNRKGVVQFSPGSTNVNVCKGSPWTFRNLYRDDYQGTFLARYAAQALGAKKAAVFYENDDYGKGLMEAFVKEAAEQKLEVISPISFVGERTQDFKPLVEQVKDEAPDVIFVSGLYNEAALITKTARKDLGMDVPVLAGDGVMSEEFIRTAGDAAEGALVTTPFLFEAAVDNPAAKEFFEKFRQRNQKDPDTWAALTYDAVGMALQAIAEAGPDRAAIRDWLAGRTSKEKAYSGVTGLTFFDAEGDCFSKGAHVAVVRGGKFVAAEKQLSE